MKSAFHAFPADPRDRRAGRRRATVVGAALAATVLFGPLVFWSPGTCSTSRPQSACPSLGFWGIVLATLYLVVGWLPKMVITGVVFLIDPSGFHGAARVHWPSRHSATSSPSRCRHCSRHDHMRTRRNSVTTPGGAWRNNGCVAGPRCSPRSGVLGRIRRHHYESSLRPCLGTSIAPRRRATFRKSLLR